MKDQNIVSKLDNMLSTSKIQIYLVYQQQETWSVQRKKTKGVAKVAE